MRQIATFDKSDEVYRFSNFLIDSGIRTKVEPEGDKFCLWIHREDDVPKAKEQLEKFRANPSASDYAKFSTKPTESSRAAPAGPKKGKRSQTNVVRMSEKWRTSQVSSGRRPVTLALIVISILVFLNKQSTSSASLTSSSLSFRFQDALLFRGMIGRNDSEKIIDRLAFTQEDAPPATRLKSIMRGEVWRLVTPMFVHFGMLHIIFNMIMLFQIGGAAERRWGPWRYLLFVIAAQAVSGIFQALVPTIYPPWLSGGVYFGGMSGVLYALFGFAVIRQQTSALWSGMLTQGSIQTLMIWLFLGLFGALAYFGMNIANWSHGIGFLFGVLVAQLAASLQRKK